MESNKSNFLLLARGKGHILGCTLFFILSVLDGALTLWGLGLGSIEEVNPVMQWLINKSLIGFMVVKSALPVILGFVLWRIRNKSHKLVDYLFGFMLIVYSVVIVFHVYWILGL